MALSQPATFNEEWSDQRVLTYLNHLPPEGVNPDFHVLYTAYKHMRPHDFKRLLVAFVANGRDINATDTEGNSIKHIISGFPRHSTDFLDILNDFGAQ